MLIDKEQRLPSSPDEFTQWHTFSDERQRGRARAWLASEGYWVARSSMP